MFGMVTALVVQDETAETIQRTAGATPVVAAASAVGSSAYLCQVAGPG